MIKVQIRSFIIQAEKFRRFDWFIASLFPRNSGITAKIDGITTLPCYTTAAVTAKAMIYKLLSLNCLMLSALNGLYWFHKKLSIISSIDVKDCYERRRLCLFFFNRKKKGLLCVTENFSASIINK